MALERERKFLVKKERSLPIENAIYIRQGYFIANKEKQMRIRISNPILFSRSFFQNKNPSESDTKAILGYKKHINVTDREEHEWEVDLSMGEEMYKVCDWKIEKQRGIVGRWEVDLYELKNGESLLVAEIEYSDEEPFPDVLPDWIGEEITGKSEYSNIVLAKNNK